MHFGNLGHNEPVAINTFRGPWNSWTGGSIAGYNTNGLSTNGRGLGGL